MNDFTVTEYLFYILVALGFLCGCQVAKALSFWKW